MQDIPKENYLLCSDCERKLAIIETIFARYIEQIHSYKANRSSIEHVTQQNYLICKYINPKLFKLFFYSILWLLSVTSLMEYSSFKLGEDEEVELRSFVDDTLRTTKKDLFSCLDLERQIPEYDLILLKPEKRLYPPSSFLSTHSLNYELHLVMFSEFSLFFATNDQNLKPMMKLYSNKQNNKVIDGMGRVTSWIDFNNKLIKQFQNPTNTSMS